MASSRWSARAPEHLPEELIEILCSFFTGFEAFNLSHTTSWWKNYLSDESFWKKCFRGWKTSKSWKRRYIQSRSMLFTRLKIKNVVQPLDAFAYLTRTNDQHLPTHFQLTHMGGESFSFDIWFTLLPASDEEHFGGILYGIQSSSRESGQSAHYQKEFVVVNPSGELYCSVLADNPVVARDLKPNDWYHVALTYNHETQRQEVFLNGVNVQSKSGIWRYHWHFMMYGQVGTGYCSADSAEWCGFHGVIDEFRVWRGVLSPDDVKLLASGGALSNEKLQASLQQDAPEKKLRNVQIVKCTRPTEARMMQVVK